MTNRERFRAAMAFEPTDRPCHIEHGFWPETYARWRNEGLPDDVRYPPFAYVDEPPDLFDHFGVTRYAYVLPGQYYLPEFEPCLIEETETTVTIRDGRGVTMRRRKSGASLPQYLDYPVKCRRDYESVRERLQPRAEERYPADFDRIAAAVREDQDVVVCTHTDGFFAFLRELMGVERMLYALYDDPDLVRDMVDDRCGFTMQVYERAIRETKPDFAFVWEDCCFANGPLISPTLFRELLMPAYRRFIGYLNDMGVAWVIVDSDGDVLDLLPLWTECGVTGVLPFEVKAGMDVCRIGEAFSTLQIVGGVDKHALERGPDDIDAELDRVLPTMLRRGGYAVALDHWTQPEIPLGNFGHYAGRVATYPMPRSQ